MSQARKRRIEDEDNEELDNKEISNGLSQAALEHSIFGIQPTNDFVRVVSDFLFSYVGRKNVEIEAKLGVFLHRETRERIRVPVRCETIIDLDRWTVFESNMTLEQHKNFNELLNKRFIETKAPSHKGYPIEYVHTYEIDRFYNTENKRIRVTRDQKTGNIVDIVEKIRLGDLNIYSPNTKLDYRISVNIENPGKCCNYFNCSIICDQDVNIIHLTEKMPEGQHCFERNKDRLSYTHQIVKIDLTQVKVSDVPTKSHELEIEFINPGILYEEKLKIENSQENRYTEIVEHFLNNIRMLAKKAN